MPSKPKEPAPAPPPAAKTEKEEIAANVLESVANA
jgi:hypothetical protein